MDDNPYKSPLTEPDDCKDNEAVFASTHALNIAWYFNRLLYMWVVMVGCVPLVVGLPTSDRPLVAFALAAHLLNGYYAFKLATTLSNPVGGAVFGVLALVPIVNLPIVAVLNIWSSIVFQRHGGKFGLFWAYVPGKKPPGYRSPRW